MEQKTINELKKIINKVYSKSNDSKISLYLHIMNVLDLYDEKITEERKRRIKKEYNL